MQADETSWCGACLERAPMNRARSAMWIGLLCVSIYALPATASAQSAALPSATVLTTQLTGVDAGEGAAFDRTVRARLDALGVVRTEGAVALDLEQIQLALGCMGETTECLSSVASETQTPIIVVPSLARAGDTVVATVLVFDGRDQSTRRGTRETSATNMSSLLGGVDGLLREVFGLPAASRSDPGGVSAAPPEASGLSAVPFVVIGIGAAALIAGAIVGGISIGDASTFTSSTNDTRAQVDASLAVLSRQQTEATVADALLIGGGIVVAAGIIWELVAGREDGSSPLALAPIVSSTQVGLALSGSFGGAL